MKNLFLFYLRILAKIQLAKIRPVIIGVGGAAGKTSLSNFICLILKEKYKVLESKGKNSETGIPLAVLGVDPGNYALPDWLRVALVSPIKLFSNWDKFDFFVAEMGIDGPFEPKNMSYLLKIIRPKIGVLTNIALEHSEYFDTLVPNSLKGRKNRILELIAKEEGLLLKSLPKDGLAVINLDDPLISKINTRSQRVTVSSKKKADFYIKNVDIGNRGFRVNFEYNNDIYEIVTSSLLPFYYSYSLVMAIAVATRLGFNVSSAIEALQKNFSLPSGRFSVFRGIKNTLIFDSSYNSSPAAVDEALQLLSKIKGKRRVAILGDMRELGRVSAEEHKELGRLILKNTDFVILIGPQVSNFTAPVLVKAGHPFLSFPDFTSAKKAILESVHEKDLILVKGSQNTLYLERVVEMLLKDKDDIKKLPRRGRLWDKKRREAK